jgi:Protein of unknown function (DUF3501)
VKPVSIQEILSIADYERVRPRLRPLFMAEKDRRRLSVGEHMTLLFENGQTVWYQIQEMVRIERMTDAAAIEHEIETYNELVPGAGELCATLLIEYPDPSGRDEALKKLVGLESHLWLVLDQRRQAVGFDARQISAERVSSVQFLRFRLDEIGAEEFPRLAGQGRVSLEVDHPHLSARAVIEGALAAALATDLRQD